MAQNKQEKNVLFIILAWLIAIALVILALTKLKSLIKL